MKKDFFNIPFFIDSSEILPICHLFNHNLYDSYQNLISTNKMEQIDSSKTISTDIQIQDETYFVIETLAEDAPILNQLFHHKIKQHLEYVEMLSNYEYYKKSSNDLMSSLLSDLSNNQMERELVNYLRVLRGYVLVKSINLYLISDRIQISHWIDGVTGEVFPAESNFDECNIHCAAISANLQKAFISNTPLGNKLYLECRPNLTHMPKNFIYIPLIKNEEVLAVLELKNLMTGDFTNKELFIINCASRVICQFLDEKNSYLTLQHSEKTTTGLAKYLSSNVVAHIKTKEIIPDEISGVEKEIVVLFAKINNFSEISEKLPASILIDLLNYHFEFMAKIISEHGGTLDKIIGGVIMAIWGHPKEQVNGLELAINTAIEMQKIVSQQISLIWREQGITNYGLGIGINRGKAVAGNLGAKQFMDFTVIGDTINLAQRLESNAKIGEIWLKTEVVNLDKTLKIKPNKSIKGVKVKGVANPINVYVFTPLETVAKGLK